MTSMSTIKRSVTDYFKQRKLLIRAMSGKGIRANSDFLELFVLRQVVAAAHRTAIRQTQGHVFVVSAGPSPDWNGASYVELTTPSGKTFGARTGLEVGTHDGGRVELDCLVVPMPQPGSDGSVSSGSVSLAFECKAHKKNISATLANEVIGKAVRVWAGVRVPALAGRPAYSVVSLTAATQGTASVLAQYGIGFLLVAQAAAHARATVDSL